MLKVSSFRYVIHRVGFLFLCIEHHYYFLLIEYISLPRFHYQYELEREKLATELEEERKSHKEREQCIKEQQMKIENLSSLVTFSDSDGKSSQVKLIQCKSLKSNDKF